MSNSFKIYRVRFYGSDGNWHASTLWHISRSYCENYINNAVMEGLDIEESSVIKDDD